MVEQEDYSDVFERGLQSVFGVMVCVCVCESHRTAVCFLFLSHAFPAAEGSSEEVIVKRNSLSQHFITCIQITKPQKVLTEGWIMLLFTNIVNFIPQLRVG